jgi:hypothetical protein
LHSRPNQSFAPQLQHAYGCPFKVHLRQQHAWPHYCCSCLQCNTPHVWLPLTP